MRLGWSQRAFPGEARQLREVRRYVDGLLTDYPDRDAVIACVAELASNAIIHTRSKDGGTFIVQVQCASGAVRVAVTDAGAPTQPAIRNPQDGKLAEGGRGLAIVAELADQMGVEGNEQSRTVWARFRWPAKQDAHSMLPETEAGNVLVQLGTKSSGWVCWFGEHTRQWWAMPRTAKPLLVAASSAETLAHRIAVIEQNGA